MSDPIYIIHIEKMLEGRGGSLFSHRPKKMITIESDQPVLGKALERLVYQVNRGGGWIYEDLVLVAEAGSIRVESRLPEGRDDLLVSIPENLLLSIDEAALRIHGDEIVIDSFPDHVSTEKRQLFETVIEIYNLCGKIPAHREADPRHAFEEKSEIRQILKEGRSSGPESPQTSEERLLNDFLHARFFSFAHGSAKTRHEVLMPILDFLNHHPSAPGFLSKTSRHPDHPAIGVSHWKAGPDSHECFVSYAFFDAFDLFVNYGYLERGCGFVRSIPLEIDLEGIGLLRVRSLGGAHFRRELPTRLVDLRKWMPTALKIGPGEFELSHLVIPGADEKHALRRVLASMISGWQPRMDLERVAEYVAEAERSVLVANVDYYERLARCSDRLPASEAAAAINLAAREMPKLQLELLKAYEFSD
jgi:hypothetical protein